MVDLKSRIAAMPAKSISLNEEVRNEALGREEVLDRDSVFIQIIERRWRAQGLSESEIERRFGSEDFGSAPKV